MRFTRARARSLVSADGLSRHFVWSTLDKSGVPHFDSKYAVGEHLTKIGAVCFLFADAIDLDQASKHTARRAHHSSVHELLL